MPAPSSSSTVGTALPHGHKAHTPRLPQWWSIRPFTAPLSPYRCPSPSVGVWSPFPLGPRRRATRWLPPGEKSPDQRHRRWWCEGHPCNLALCKSRLLNLVGLCEWCGTRSGSMLYMLLGKNSHGSRQCSKQPADIVYLYTKTEASKNMERSNQPLLKTNNKMSKQNKNRNQKQTNRLCSWLRFSQRVNDKSSTLNPSTLGNVILRI